VEIIKDQFKDIIMEDQAVLDTPKGVKYLLELVPDDNLRQECEKAMENKCDSADKWKAFCRTVQLHNQEDTKVPHCL
jgi:hypothetical protein